jgi:DNA repair exonuclease SbcCD ATPase subunit
VLAEVFGVCQTDLAGATATVELGIAGNTAALIAQTEAEWTECVSAQQRLVAAQDAAKRRAAETKEDEAETQHAKTDAAAALSVLQSQINTKREQHKAVMAKVKALRENVDDSEVEYRRRLNRNRAWLRNYPNVQRAYTEDMTVLQMAQRALGRDGIPALVSALLCPRLNASAAYYAHLLADGAVQVKFSMDAEELVVAIDNPTGGEHVTDQSAGELRTAGLITTLALRDSVQANVLFLDEMSLGLDALGAQELARGVNALRTRFQAIFVTSHDPYVLNGLEDYTLLEVRKRNGISTISTGVSTADCQAPGAEAKVSGQSAEGREGGKRQADTGKQVRQGTRRTQPKQVHTEGGQA